MCLGKLIIQSVKGVTRLIVTNYEYNTQSCHKNIHMVPTAEED